MGAPSLRRGGWVTLTAMAHHGGGGRPEHLVASIPGRLAEPRPSISFEFFPPKTDESEAQLWTAIRQLERVRPAFVSVTYGAGGTTQDRTVRVTGRIADETSLTPLAHLTCVGMSVREVRRSSAGTPPPVSATSRPPRGPARQLGTVGAAPRGARPRRPAVALISGLGDFTIGVAAFPDVHPDSPDLDHDVEVLVRKADAGASFAITQMVFDADSYLRLRDRVAARRDLPITPGLMPVTNLRQIHRMSSSWARPPAGGRRAARGRQGRPGRGACLDVQIATELGQRMLDEGAPGIHFITPRTGRTPTRACSPPTTSTSTPTAASKSALRAGILTRWATPPRCASTPISRRRRTPVASPRTRSRRATPTPRPAGNNSANGGTVLVGNEQSGGRRAEGDANSDGGTAGARRAAAPSAAGAPPAPPMPMPTAATAATPKPIPWPWWRRACPPARGRRAGGGSGAGGAANNTGAATTGGAGNRRGDVRRRGAAAGNAGAGNATGGAVAVQWLETRPAGPAGPPTPGRPPGTAGPAAATRPRSPVLGRRRGVAGHDAEGGITGGNETIASIAGGIAGNTLNAPVTSNGSAFARLRPAPSAPRRAALSASGRRRRHGPRDRSRFAHALRQMLAHHEGERVVPDRERLQRGERFLVCRPIAMGRRSRASHERCGSDRTMNR